MTSVLKNIQETVMKYADIMSKVAKVDVEVVDENFYRVAGTGIFSEIVDMDMSDEAYVYSHVMKTGRRQIIYEPGKDDLCSQCQKKDTCREVMEISMPINMGGEIIGVIGLVGSNQESKNRILENEEMYLNLLDQISDFISVKATEYLEIRRQVAMLGIFGKAINHMEQATLIIGKDNVITTANDSARKELGIKLLEGLAIKITKTGDKIRNENEYKLNIRGKEFTVFGEMHAVERPIKRYSSIILFKTSKNIHNNFYEMTSTVNSLGTENIIGISKKTEELRRDIEKVAKNRSTVLITGESGTGKEMVATAIWRASDRRNKKFVAINCAAIPEALLESELFGYVKGAFTGADPNGRIGKFELADQGVIFLDEIGDMPIYLQTKLLRVIQERNIVRIGSNQVIPINVRIIAATNKNLKEMIAAKKFREDLYYRLNVIPLNIAPLRERKEDVCGLAYYFAKRYAALFEKSFLEISNEAMRVLESYPWLGNVRELENTVEFMINMMEDDGVLRIETLPDDLFSNSKSKVNYDSEIVPLKILETEEIKKAIQKFGNSTQGKKDAAKSLGIGIATLYRKIDDLSL